MKKKITAILLVIVMVVLSAPFSATASVNHVLRVETGEGFWHSGYFPIDALGLEAGHLYQVTVRVFAPEEITIRLMREILPSATDGQEWQPPEEWDTANFHPRRAEWITMSIPLDLRTRAGGNIWLRRPYGWDGAQAFYIDDFVVTRGGQEVLRLDFEGGSADFGGFHPVDAEGSTASMSIVADPNPGGNQPAPAAQPTPQAQPTPTPAAAEATAPVVAASTIIQLRIGDPVFTVNGARGYMDVAPIIVDNRTLVPLRFVGETLGAQFAWEGTTETVTIFHDGQVLSFAIGELAEGMDVPAQNYNGRTIVPLRFVSEFFGIEAGFNSTTQMVTLTVAGQAQAPAAPPQPTAATPEEPTPEAALPTPTQVPAPQRPAPAPGSLPSANRTGAIDFNAVMRESNFNLRPALTATPLKDIFADFFTIGVALNGNNISNVSINSPELAALTAFHFNSVSYSNLMKPDFLLDPIASRRNARNGDETAVGVRFDSAIPGMEFAQANNIGMRGHTLLWHNQTPDWFFREGFLTDGALVSRDVMIARLESYISQVLDFFQTNYPGVVYAWDVVNEAVTTAPGQFNNASGWHTRSHWGDSNNPRSNRWYEVIGPDYVRYAFYFARRYAAPDVRLFYNDYNTFQRDRTDAMLVLMEYLLDLGLVDGIGLQSAMGLTWPSSLRTGTNNMVQELQRFGELGLEIHISELCVRIGSDSPSLFQQQADRYRDVFDILLEMHVLNGGPANIANVTFFGLMDCYKFYEGFCQYYWIFDKNLQPKPAFHLISEAVRDFRR
ncbi:MAG: endo-1,4-beta-xylanase [Defluviitaleaceae bacterium]|nr:endo-1,4-beta-xylanase [Defluviitaleaceae bacterium]